MIRGSILNPSKKGGVKRRDLLFVLTLPSLVFVISLIYTVKMRKKLLFFTDSLAVLLNKRKNRGNGSEKHEVRGLCYTDHSWDFFRWT